MKILIWIGCAFIFGLINATCIAVGISLGGIPTVLIAAALFFLAKLLCKKWDKTH